MLNTVFSSETSQNTYLPILEVLEERIMKWKPTFRLITRCSVSHNSLEDQNRRTYTIWIQILLVQVAEANVLSIIFRPTNASMWNRYLESGSLAMSCSSTWSVLLPTPTAITVMPLLWASRACSLVRFLYEDTPSVTTMANFGTPALWPSVEEF